MNKPNKIGFGIIIKYGDGSIDGSRADEIEPFFQEITPDQAVHVLSGAQKELRGGGTDIRYFVADPDAPPLAP